MINTIPRKTGRPIAVYTMRDGTRVPGLMRLQDGRWRASGPEKHTFSEPDEGLAVARFHAWQARRRQAVVNVPLAGAHIADADAVRRALAGVTPPQPFPRQTPGADPFVQQVERYARNMDDGQDDPGPPPKPVRVELDGEVLLFFRDPVQAEAFWPWLRRLIIKEPKYVARMTGIEQIGYLDDLRAPEPSPTLQELIDNYAAKPGLSGEEVTRVRRFWRQFADAVGVKTIRDLTHDHVVTYERLVTGEDLAPKSIRHRYGGVRTVIAYALRRGKGQADCRAALDKLSMLEVPEADTLDPRPIGPEDFWRIHGAATRAKDEVFAAMMLFALNAALYSSEVGAVRWDEVDLKLGEYAARRSKTKVPRVAVLWPETVKALTALPRGRDTVFNTRVQAYNRFSVHRDWTRYRLAAKVKAGVTFAMIRDAAFTAACRVSLDQARVLSGHRMPGAVDAYVLRSPQFVADACAALHEQFFARRAGLTRREARVAGRRPRPDDAVRSRP